VVRNDGDDDDEDDNHSTATYVIDMYWVKATWSCTATDCGSLPGAALAMDHEWKLHQYSPNYHRIFQSLFCHNLRVSDDPVYDDATGCSITFDV